MDLRELNWGGPGYAAYEVVMKVSGKENSTYSMMSNESQYLMNMMQTQFQEQQGVFNWLVNPLKQMIINPQGFGSKALADMRSYSIGTIGQQLENQQRSLQQNFASQNMAGLGSGVQVGAMAQLGSQAASQEATALQQIQIANAQAQLQQQQFGVQSLMGVGQGLGMAPQSMGGLQSALGQQFSASYNMAQQGGFWSNLARGVTTAAGMALGAVADPFNPAAGMLAGAQVGGSIGGGVFGGGGGQPMAMPGGYQGG